MNTKRNNIIFNIILSSINIFSFMEVISNFIPYKDINELFSLISLFLGLIIILNIKSYINKNLFMIDYCLLWIILLYRINILNKYIELIMQNYIAIAFIFIEMIFRIYIIKNSKLDNYEQEKNRGLIIH